MTGVNEVSSLEMLVVLKMAKCKKREMAPMGVSECDDSVETRGEME